MGVSLQRVCVYCASNDGAQPVYIEAARAFGRTLAERGITVEEFFETWTWAQLGVHRKPVGLLNVADFWRPLISLLDHLEREEFLRGTPRDWLVMQHDANAMIDALAGFEPPTVRRWLRAGET